MSSLCALIVNVVEDGGANMISFVTPIKRRLGIKKKDDESHQKDDYEKELERRLGIPGCPSN